VPAPVSRVAFRPYAAREGHAVKDARHTRSFEDSSSRPRARLSERRECTHPIAPHAGQGLPGRSQKNRRS